MSADIVFKKGVGFMVYEDFTSEDHNDNDYDPFDDEDGFVQHFDNDEIDEELTEEE